VKTKYELHAAVTDAKGVTTTRRIYGTREALRFSTILHKVSHASAGKSELRAPVSGNRRKATVLDGLKTGTVYTSLSVLARYLGLTPASLSQQMSRLRRKGATDTFTIRGVTFRLEGRG
jgi:CRP-like cAMP-binding protein